MICALNAGSIFTATFFCPIFTISREMKIVRAQNLGGIYLGIGFFWAPLFWVRSRARRRTFTFWFWRRKWGGHQNRGGI